MNTDTEQEFVRNYIDKNFQDRLIYELSSSKKRVNAMARFSHNAEAVLDKSLNKKVIKSHDEIRESDKTLYLISSGENDGVTLPFSDAIRHCENSYSAVIVIGKGFSLIKEETECGKPKMLYLKKP